MKDVIVFDLDGTLANVDHRVHLIRDDKPDWDAFFRECVNDAPNDWCVTLIQVMSVFRDVRIVSARSKVVESETREWLLKALGPKTCADIGLVMLREAGNHEPDVDLKRRWLNESGLRDRILFVVDDRQRIVDMWRDEGLTCLQCYEWAEHAKKKTPDL